MIGSEILKRIIGDNCTVQDINEEDVRKQAQSFNEDELQQTGGIAFTKKEIDKAIESL